MARQTFTWHPDYDSKLSQEPSVSVTKFGDGYEQRTPNGINNNPETWSVEFTRSSASFPDVLAFIQARNGVESFYWTTPFNQEKIFVCRKWGLVRKEGHLVISMDFEQVFEA
jgi:phage-related protein